MNGTTINGKYELRRILAESHLYKVYDAQEIETGTTVVVKILKEEMSGTTDRVRHFSEEVRSFASLSHPAIAQVLDVDMCDGLPFVVTEPVAGKDLRAWIKGEPLPFEECIRIVQQIAAVLHYAAREKVPHRSVKLSNIFRTDDGKVKILSFSHPRLKLVGATPSDEDSGIQSDLFSLGTTLFELLSGESAIRKRGGINELWDARLTQGLRLRHPHLNPERIEQVVDCVERTLTREVKQRFAGHEDFQLALHRLEGNTRRTLVETRKRSELATASAVVDAFNGRNAMAIAVGGGGGGGGGVAVGGVGEVGGYGSVDFSTTSADINPILGGPSTGFQRPKLRVLSGGKAANTVEAGSIWKGSEDAPAWRNPLVFMSLLLALMVILILFW